MKAAWIAVVLALSACGGSGSEAPAPTATDLDMRAEDFGCINEWERVRRFRITNKAGFLAEALAVANAGQGTYPVGTIIQLIPDEAMVKRRKGWNAATNDWEFFALTSYSDGRTEIRSRGAEGTVNAFGGNCFACHAKALPEYDFVCESGHGCDPLSLSSAIIDSLQASDPRCR